MTVKRYKTVVAVLLMVTVLTGCWNKRELEHMFYAHALGVDYKDGNYIVYVQLLDFTALGKQEGGGGKQTPTGAWVGKGEGTSIQAALHDLYSTTQRRIYWGHLSSLVASENVLKIGLHTMLDQLTRYSEFRYTLWVFGTQSSIKDVLLASPIMENSPAYSQLGDPRDVYEQSSFIEPLRLHRFIVLLRERGKTAKIPMITLIKGEWADKEHDYAAIGINGIALMRSGRWHGMLTKDKLLGMRWLERDTNRAPIVIKDGGKTTASLILRHPKPVIHPKITGDSLKFDIDVDISAGIVELSEPIDEETLRERTERQIEHEIRETFREGVKLDEDVLNLTDVLYRQNVKEWKRLDAREKNMLSHDSLQLVRVHVSFKDGGKTTAPFPSGEK